MFSRWRALEKGAEEITVLLEDHKGRIWCGTIAGLYQVERNKGEWRFHFVDLGLSRKNCDSWLIGLPSFAVVWMACEDQPQINEYDAYSADKLGSF